MYIDLHTHSTASDGTLTPKELILQAQKAGLAAVALTDHDTTAGLGQAMETAEKLSIECIAGIELAAYFNGREELHIVGLFIDYKKKDWIHVISQIQKDRDNRNIEMISKLNAIGVSITMEQLEQAAGGDIITRAHYAKVLEQNGYVTSKKEAFQFYLSPGCPGYVPRQLLSPEECIRLIHESGGLSILAHPTLYHLSFQEIGQVVGRLKKEGLDGMEVMYSTYTPEEEKKMKQIAAENNLLFSGGSDFHGANKPDIQLAVGKGNLKIPLEYLHALRAKMAENQL